MKNKFAENSSAPKPFLDYINRVDFIKMAIKEDIRDLIIPIFQKRSKTIVNRLHRKGYRTKKVMVENTKYLNRLIAPSVLEILKDKYRDAARASDEFVTYIFSTIPKVEKLFWNQKKIKMGEKELKTRLNKSTGAFVLGVADFSEALVSNGVKIKAGKEILEKEIKEANGKVGTYFRAITVGAQSQLTKAVDEAAYNAFNHRKVHRYEWIAFFTNTCPDCADRHGKIYYYDTWKAIGLPRSGVTVCRSHCHCILIPVDSSIEIAAPVKLESAKIRIEQYKTLDEAKKEWRKLKEKWRKNPKRLQAKISRKDKREALRIMKSHWSMTGRKITFEKDFDRANMIGQIDTLMNYDSAAKVLFKSKDEGVPGGKYPIKFYNTDGLRGKVGGKEIIVGGLCWVKSRIEIGEVHPQTLLHEMCHTIHFAVLSRGDKKYEKCREIAKEYIQKRWHVNKKDLDESINSLSWYRAGRGLEKGPKKGVRFLTEYSKTSSKEDFAESLSLVMSKPFAKADKTLYKFLHQYEKDVLGEKNPRPVSYWEERREKARKERLDNIRKRSEIMKQKGIRIVDQDGEEVATVVENLKARAIFSRLEIGLNMVLSRPSINGRLGGLLDNGSYGSWNETIYRGFTREFITAALETDEIRSLGVYYAK